MTVIEHKLYARFEKGVNISVQRVVGRVIVLLTKVILLAL
jgi:hypothetical protein